MTDRLTVSVAEAAQLLGCSEHHAYLLVHEGILPPVPHLPRLRIARITLQRFVEGQL